MRLHRSAPVLVAALLVALGAAGGPSAQTRDVRIDITTGQGRRIRVHCEALASSGGREARAFSVQADEVLADDLENSAVFTVSRGWAAGQPFDVEAVIGGRWVVTGSQVKLTGEVRDFPARRPILVKEYRGLLRDWRALVHQFADDIVLQFTGEPGVSLTRIAFIGQRGRDKELLVMDLDGARLKALTQDRSITSTPRWAPDASLLLFTSYRAGRGPQVVVIPPDGGKAYLVSGRKGLNTSASYSPDGRDIVCTLSQDGNSEIYLLDARGGTPRRLTSNRGIDTSPGWSPTGQEIAFTSDRTGSPQVYIMDRDGGNVRRLTFDADYTDSPAWSPKGDRLAFVVRTGQGFDIYMCRPDGSDVRPIVTGGSNENPSWSPDGRHLVFASNRGGDMGLFVTDLDDRPPRRLDAGGWIAHSPAWSPRLGGTRSAVNLDVSTQPGGTR